MPTPRASPPRARGCVPWSAPSVGCSISPDVSRSLPPSLTPIPIPLHQARARVKDPVVPAPALKAYRPPFWESKRFGEPYGDFNREPPPRNVVRVAPTSPGRPHTTTRGEPADLTNRPAVSRSLNAMDASSAFAAARARAKAAKPVAVDDTRATGVMAAYTRNASCPSARARAQDARAEAGHAAARARHGRFATCVRRVRRVRHRRRQRTEDERRGAFGSERDRPARVRARLARARRRRDGCRSGGGVQQVRTDGARRAHAHAHVRRGAVGPPARLSNMATAIRKGAFTREEATGRKKLVGPARSRGRSSTPLPQRRVHASGFDGSALVRSASEADARLELEFVHGYARDCHANNLFYIKARKDAPEADETVSSSTRARASAERTLGGSIPAEELAEDTEIVYCVAGLGVVYDKRRNAQRFFRGHTDDVKCLTVSRAKDLCASGQLGREPTAIVWDPYTCAGLKVLTHPRGTRGVAAAGFDRDAKTLATVGMDNNHTIFVWAWRSGTCVHQLRGHADVPRRCTGSSSTGSGGPGGVPHLRRQPRQVLEKDGRRAQDVFGQTVQTVARIRRGVRQVRPDVQEARRGVRGVLAQRARAHGHPRGLHRGLVRRAAANHAASARAHAPGPSVTRVDGPPTHHGVRCLRLRADGETLLSAGRGRARHRLGREERRFEGVVGDFRDARCGARMGDRARPCSSGSIVPRTRGTRSSRAPTAATSGRWSRPLPPRAPTANSTEKANRRVASASSSRVLVNGHSSDLYSVAWSPTEAATYATASEGETVNVWCAERRVLKRAVSLGNARAQRGVLARRRAPRGGMRERRRARPRRGDVDAHAGGSRRTIAR